MGENTPASACDIVIASNRLPVTVEIDEDGAVATSSAGGLVSALRGLARASPLGRLARPPPSRRSARRAVATLARGRGCSRSSSRGRGRGLLRPHVQRDALAALPLLRRPAALHRRGVGELRGGQRPLRRHDRRHRAPARARLGARLPPCAPARGAPRRAAPTSRSASSCTSRSPPPRSTACSRRASELLHGMLGADYVGFQTGDYARHFRSVVPADPRHGVRAAPDRGRRPGRRDRRPSDRHRRRDASATTLADPGDRGDRGRARASATSGKQLVLGVERLDYTKGIPEKLDAFERILELEPERARTTTMLQVLVPSRLESPEYRSKRDEIEQRIAHLNGRFGQLGTTRSSTCTGRSRCGARRPLPARRRDDGRRRSATG